MLYRLTLIGLYNYDPTIYDALTFPDGIDHETAVNSIILRAGEMGCIYSNPEFLRFAMRNWSAKNREPLQRILRALTEDYNPIHNYDRYEESKDSATDNFTEAREINGTQSGTTDASDSKTAEETVSADNASEYQPDRKTEENGTSTATTSGSNNSKDDVTHSGQSGNEHSAHLYGNIGVTTSAQMIAGEMDIRKDYRIYDIIADMFVSEFCEMTY